MKILKLIIVAVVFSSSFNGLAQELSEKKTPENEDIKMDKKSYYETRGEEDAKFEQQFKSDEEDKEDDFWEDQKAYEKDLKERDKKAYKAYRKGKRDAYKEHYKHCDSHCHHSHYYYQHASFYYHGYYNYRRGPNYSRTRVRIGTPRVRLNIL